jgi:hypothetical protein
LGFSFNKAEFEGGAGDFEVKPNGTFLDKSGKAYKVEDLINFVYREYRPDYPVGKRTSTASGEVKSVIRWVKKVYVASEYGSGYDYCGHAFNADIYLNGVNQGVFSYERIFRRLHSLL